MAFCTDWKISRFSDAAPRTLLDDVLHDINVFSLTRGFTCSGLVFTLCATGFQIRKLFSPLCALHLCVLCGSLNKLKLFSLQL